MDRTTNGTRETVRLSAKEWAKIGTGLLIQIFVLGGVLLGFLVRNENRLTVIETTQKMLVETVKENTKRIRDLEDEEK